MTENEFDREMGIILEAAGANFLQVRTDLVRYLDGNGNAAIVMSYVLNLLRLKEACDRDRLKLIEEDLWFPCPAKRIQSELGIWDKKQQRVIALLKKKELIETKNRQDNILWIRVKTDTLKRIRNWPKDRTHKSDGISRNDFSGEVETTFPVKSKRLFPIGTKNSSKNLSNTPPSEGTAKLSQARSPSTEKSSSEERRTSKPVEPKKDSTLSINEGFGPFFNEPEKKKKSCPWHMKAASDLYHGLKAKKLILHHLNGEMFNWGYEFTSLEKDIMWRDKCISERARERIQDHLEWFIPNIGGAYIPQVLNAKDFREKFVQIEQAKLRPEKIEQEGTRLKKKQRDEDVLGI